MDQVFDEIIEMRGLRFHYRDWHSKRPDAPTLILLHGFTDHARAWDPFAEAMSNQYRVLALDQRGHGESGWAPATQYSVDDLVADLEGLVGAMKLDHFSLLGLSYGGLVAMIYAARRPAALAACVVVDYGPEIDPAGQARIRNSVQLGDTFATRAEAFATARAGNSRPPEALHRKRSDAGLMRTEDGRWTYRYDRALRSPGTLRFLDPATIWSACSSIAAPTQIIRGEVSDILSTAIAEKMVHTIPDARLLTVSGAGHPVPYDAPEGFLTAVRSFLKG